jgi:hypothetical protein
MPAAKQEKGAGWTREPRSLELIKSKAHLGNLKKKDKWEY